MWYIIYLPLRDCQTTCFTCLWLNFAICPATMTGLITKTTQLSYSLKFKYLGLASFSFTYLYGSIILNRSFGCPLTPCNVVSLDFSSTFAFWICLMTSVVSDLVRIRGWPMWPQLSLLTCE